MASRSSGGWNAETYQGTRRGRAMGGDIGWEMFPERTEVTDIYEDPDAVDVMNRGTLADYTPDQNGLMEASEPRRNVHAVERLNLRADGARTTTMPWQNEDYDTQFHDHDPRGYSPEQPWQEYRRLATAVQRRSDFRDDGDYSVPETGISPYEMNARIRGTQDWFKARFKNFATSFDNFHAGGVGMYPNMSNVYKSDAEDGTVNPDADLASDAVGLQHATTHLSNIVHEGSAALRANSTTDHRVGVSAYGKLYANAGLMPHESQLRSLEDDTPRQRSMAASANRSLRGLMSVVDEDASAATGLRRAMQDTVGDTEKFGGPRESAAANRSIAATRDIMALLGWVEQDIKQLRQLERTNATVAAPLIANFARMAEAIHALPANAKLEAREALLLSAASGRGMGDIGAQRFRVDVNPKLVQYMDNAVRTASRGGDIVAAATGAAITGSDVAKYGGGIAASDIYQLRGQGGPADAQANRRAADASETKFAASRARGNYAALAAGAARADLVGHSVTGSAMIAQALLSHVRAPALIGATDMAAARYGGSATDVDFQDTGGLRRSTAAHGDKTTVRRGQLSDMPLDEMSDN